MNAEEIAAVREGFNKLSEEIAKHERVTAKLISFLVKDLGTNAVMNLWLSGS